MRGDSPGWSAELRTAFESLPFEVEKLPDPFPMAAHGKLEWTDPAGVEKELARHGFHDVKVQTIDQASPVDSAEDFLARFGMMKTWVINTYWSEASKEKAAGMLDEHIINHLKQKHDGKGWKLRWKMIVATCRNP